MIEDAELLRRYAEENSEAAFAELVERRVDFVYTCALRRVGGVAPLAEDVTQQVFVALARDAKRLARREVLGGWLFTTARNAAVQVVRSERRRGAREQKAHLMHELTTAPAHDAEWQRLRPVIDAALDELSEPEREAVLLRFFEGRTFGEIGTRFGLSENTVRMRVERALDKLSALLARRGVTSTAAGLGLALGGQTATAAPAGLAASATAAGLAAGGALATAGALTAFFTTMTTTKIIVGAAAAVAVGVMLNQALHVGEARAASSGDERAVPVAAQTEVVRAKVARSEAASAGTVAARAAEPAPMRVAQASTREKTESRPAAGASGAAGTSSAQMRERIGRLDALVKLTDEQKKKVTEVFDWENAAIAALSAADRNEGKGIEVRQAARDQVHDVLTPEQQKIYDRTHQSKGGAVILISAESKLARLDTLVALSPQQKVVVGKIFDEEFESLVSIPIADRAIKGMEYRQAARDQLRTVLNDQQRAKYDATPQGQGGGANMAPTK